MQYDHGVGRFEMAMICGLAIDDNIHNAGEVWKIPAGADDATNAVLQWHALTVEITGSKRI